MEELRLIVSELTNDMRFFQAVLADPKMPDTVSIRIYQAYLRARLKRKIVIKEMRAQ